MLVQYHFPKYITKPQLDRFLAGGWFRNCHLMLRTQYLCLNNDIFTVRNIRLPLQQHKFTKSQRKLMGRNGKRFTWEVGAFQIDDQKEDMFAKHQVRFKGYTFSSLQQFIAQESLGPNMFDTQQICIYDGDTLVAFSIFDLGSHSVASLLGVFDNKYSKYSLGKYTMLLEVLHTKKLSFQYYYPGYILEGTKLFDYKLHIGNMQFYDWKMARWENEFRDFDPNPTQRIKLKTTQAQQELNRLGLESRQVLYHIFSLGYMGGFSDFLKSPIFLVVGKQYGNWFNLLAYLQEEKEFVLAKARVSTEFDASILKEEDRLFTAESTQCAIPISIEKILARGEELPELHEALLKLRI